MGKGKPLSYFISKLFRRKVKINFWNKGNDVEWKLVYNANQLKRLKPINYGKDKVEFNSYPISNIPELGVYTIENGLLSCNNGWGLTREYKLILETTWFTGFSSELGKQHISVPVFPQKLNGRVLSLLSDFAINNYGHLLLDALGRYGIYLEGGFSEKDFDHVIVPGKPNQRTIEWTQKMGIPTSKVVWSYHYDFLKADELMLTSFPGIRRSYLSSTVNFLRKKLGDYPNAEKRKLYIQRKGRRKISNENEILPILADFGFEVYRPELSSNSIKDFCNAKAIIGGHGAGLTDIAFCQPGTPVLEFIPSDHTYEYFYTLADAAQLRYGYLLCNSEQTREEGSFGPSFSDYYVDPQSLRGAMLTYFGESD